MKKLINLSFTLLFTLTVGTVALNAAVEVPSIMGDDKVTVVSSPAEFTQTPVLSESTAATSADVQVSDATTSAQRSAKALKSYLKSLKKSLKAKATAVRDGASEFVQTMRSEDKDTQDEPELPQVQAPKKVKALKKAKTSKKKKQIKRLSPELEQQMMQEYIKALGNKAQADGYKALLEVLSKSKDSGKDDKKKEDKDLIDTFTDKAEKWITKIFKFGSFVVVVMVSGLSYRIWTDLTGVGLTTLVKEAAKYAFEPMLSPFQNVGKTLGVTGGQQPLALPMPGAATLAIGGPDTSICFSDASDYLKQQMGCPLSN